MLEITFNKQFFSHVFKNVLPWQTDQPLLVQQTMEMDPLLFIFRWVPASFNMENSTPTECSAIIYQLTHPQERVHIPFHAGMHRMSVHALPQVTLVYCILGSLCTHEYAYVEPGCVPTCQAVSTHSKNYIISNNRQIYTKMSFYFIDNCDGKSNTHLDIFTQHSLRVGHRC